MEFRIAHQSAKDKKRNRVIIIIYEDIKNVELLDDDLANYIKANYYITWGEQFFWQCLVRNNQVKSLETAV